MGRGRRSNVPRLSTGGLNSPNTSVDLVTTTNGAGNIKGVLCQYGAAASLTVKFYINGGGAQSVEITSPLDADGITGWIPLNLRFTSSIRVQLVRAGPVAYGPTNCSVSWALD
jgi:hypothetical protein